jgi:hypothetical protein
LQEDDKLLTIRPDHGLEAPCASSQELPWLIWLKVGCSIETRLSQNLHESQGPKTTGSSPSFSRETVGGGVTPLPLKPSVVHGPPSQSQSFNLARLQNNLTQDLLVDMDWNCTRRRTSHLIICSSVSFRHQLLRVLIFNRGADNYPAAPREPGPWKKLTVLSYCLRTFQRGKRQTIDLAPRASLFC